MRLFVTEAEERMPGVMAEVNAAIMDALEPFTDNRGMPGMAMVCVLQPGWSFARAAKACGLLQPQYRLKVMGGLYPLTVMVPPSHVADNNLEANIACMKAALAVLKRHYPQEALDMCWKAGAYDAPVASSPCLDERLARWKAEGFGKKVDAFCNPALRRWRYCWGNLRLRISGRGD